MTRTAQFRRRTATTFFTGVLAVTLIASNTTVHGQIPITQRHSRTYFGAVDALASRMFAAADVIRASGEASLDVELARRHRVEAFDRAIDVKEKFIRRNWNLQDDRARRIRERILGKLDFRRALDSQTWNRLKSHPELSFASVRTGRAQNFLLPRIAAELERNSFHSGTLADFEIPAELSLDRATLHKLRLRQNAAVGKAYVFHADDGRALSADWWPAALARPEFEHARQTFVVQRQLLERANYEEMTRTEVRQHLTQMRSSLGFLSAQFQSFWTKDRRLATAETFQRFRDAEKFLSNLDDQLRRAENAGGTTAFDGSLRFDPDRHGRNLLALLSFMHDKGLQFAPPLPDDEAAYFEVFNRMRTLYVAIAEQPNSPRTLAKLK